MSRRLSDTEHRLWARVANTVRPAAGRIMPLAESADRPTLRKTETSSSNEARERPASRRARAPGPLADLSNQRPVRRGQLDVEARLDLHGHTQDSAHRELTGFIAMQRARGARCLLVITGKGRMGAGVLRSRFLEWIASPEIRPLLAGYSRAHQRHGGDGAFYLLLKAKP
ncbi:MAG: DNA mismatch repair protein MutS [Alphaproteobacteria bacterium]|nr:DNA mismatch repair protein MutS [Alphaproteobacteria bacterium]